MPRARVRTAVAVKPGDLARTRRPKRTSCHKDLTKEFMGFPRRRNERAVELVSSWISRSRWTSGGFLWIFASVSISGDRARRIDLADLGRSVLRPYMIRLVIFCRRVWVRTFRIWIRRMRACLLWLRL